MGAIARLFDRETSVEDARAELAKATRAREAAEAAYDTSPTTQNEAGVQGAMIREGRERRLLAAAEQRQGEINSERANEARMADEARLRQFVETANTWEAACSPHVAKLIEAHDAAYVEIKALRGVIESHYATHREATELAARLGIEVKLHSRQDHQNLYGFCVRSLYRAQRESGHPVDDRHVVGRFLTPSEH